MSVYQADTLMGYVMCVLTRSCTYTLPLHHVCLAMSFLGGVTGCSVGLSLSLWRSMPKWFSILKCVVHHTIEWCF